MGRERVPQVILGLLVLAVPLAVWRSAYDHTQVKLVLAQVALAGLLIGGIMLGWSGRSGARDPWKALLDSSVLAFLAWAALSALCSSYRRPAVSELAKLTTYVLLYFTARRALNSPGSLFRLGHFWATAAVFTAFWGIFLYLNSRVTTGPPGLSYQGIRNLLGHWRDLDLSFGNPNSYGAYLAMSILFLLGFFRSYQMRKRWAGLLFLLVPFLIFALGVSRSQGAWIGFGVGLFAFLLLSSLPSGRKALLVVICFLLLAALFSSHFVDRLDDQRIYFWKGTIRMILNAPLTGMGLGSFFIYYPYFKATDFYRHGFPVDSTRHAHNELLEVTAELGAVGLVLFLVILVSFLIFAGRRMARCKGRDRYLVAGTAAGWVALLTTGLGGVDMRFPNSGIFFWLAMGMVAVSPLPLAGKETPEPSIRGRFLPLAARVAISLGLTAVLVPFFWHLSFKPLLASRELKRGILARNAERWEDAIRHLQEAIELDGDLVEAYYRLAPSRHRAKDMEGAFSAYRDLLRYAPMFAQVRCHLGQLWLEQKNPRRAIMSLHEHLRWNPFDAGAHNILGIAYDTLGIYEEATLHFGTAYELEPESPAYRRNLEISYRKLEKSLPGRE